MPKTRRIGRLGAVSIHILLIGILGPFGLNHSLIVLLWNAAMLAEVWVAFGTDNESGTTDLKGTSWRGQVVKGLFWLAVLLPLAEPFGFFDAWPAHALYASHGERLTVELHESELAEFPPSVRRYSSPPAEGSPWARLDLTGWSRAARGTPVYPQNRAGLGLAEGLVARYGVRGLVRVVIWGPADRWTGRRTRREFVGLESLEREQDRFWFNAHTAETRIKEVHGARP